MRNDTLLNTLSQQFYVCGGFHKPNDNTQTKYVVKSFIFSNIQIGYVVNKNISQLSFARCYLCSTACFLVCCEIFC